jgi:hypothetical protein
MAKPAKGSCRALMQAPQVPTATDSGNLAATAAGLARGVI